MPDLILTSNRGAVRVLSLNRPDRHNALNDALLDDYRGAMRDAIADPTVRCIVIRGEGRSFCSGRDTAEFGNHGDGGPVIDWLAVGQRSISEVLTSPKPVVAAMKGHVIGGGLEMCLAADLRISSTVLRASLPEVGFASIPDNGGTQLLTTLIGPGRAKELILTGRPIGAEEADRWGLVNRVVAEDDLDDIVVEVAEQIARNSPLATRLAKQLVDSCWAATISAGLQGELVAQTAMFSSADYQESLAARRDQRPPLFSGN